MVGFGPSGGSDHCLGSIRSEFMEHCKPQSGWEVHDFKEQDLLNTYYMAVLVSRLHILNIQKSITSMKKLKKYL